MSKLSTIQCSDLIVRMHCLYQTAREASLKQWLQRELEGYAQMDALPWYRVLECRQRGLFIHSRSGRQRTCHIHDDSLGQRDLNEVKFLLLRGPVAAYLDCHPLELERWPDELLEAYRRQLIPDHICLHAWREPVDSVKQRLLQGVDHMLQEYLPAMANEMCESNRSLRAIQHRHWQI